MDTYSDKPKRKQKRKNSENHRSPVISCFLPILSVAYIVFLFFVFYEQNYSVHDSSFDLIEVDFRKSDQICTDVEFSGTVQLRIFGSGYAVGNNWSDAFYRYSQNGQSFENSRPELFGLEIDGQAAIFALGLKDNLPPPSRQRSYKVNYDVGKIPHIICFRIRDSIVDDNFGRFNISIWGQQSEVSFNRLIQPLIIYGIYIIGSALVLLAHRIFKRKRQRNYHLPSINETAK